MLNALGTLWVANGRHPSIDAVRAALGNTGSKTTIHKYLREIEAEEDGQKANVSDAIHALVTQLEDQLQGEASTEVEAMRARMAELQKAHEHVVILAKDSPTPSGTRAHWKKSTSMHAARWSTIEPPRRSNTSAKNRRHEQQVQGLQVELRQAQLAARSSRKN